MDRRKLIALVITVLIIGALAWYFKTILSYIIISMVFALILRPLKNLLGKIRIGKFHIPLWVRTLVSILTLYALIVLIAYIFIPLLTEQIYTFSQSDIKGVIENLEKPVNRAEAWLADYGIVDASDRELETVIEEKFSQLVSITNLESIFDFFVSLIGEFFVAFFSVTFITFFFLRDGTLPKRMILAATPDSQVDKIDNVLNQSQYLL